MNLSDLVGHHILSGIEVGKMEIAVYGYTEICNFIKFTIDGATLLATEDPEDGYRSYMRDLVIVEEPCKIKLPDIRVCCTMSPDDGWCKNEVLSFVDVLSGKEILAVGTENTNDYYPCCILEYRPENMFCNTKEAATGKNDGGKWIPVTERLPERTLPPQDVLVYHDLGCGMFIDRAWYSYDKGKWCSVLGMKLRVTHWMPLPDPPEGD